MVSVSRGVCPVEWRWRVLLSCRLGVCGPACTPPRCVQASTAVMSCTVSLPWSCGVRVRVCVCAVRVVGYPASAPPSSAMRMGACRGGGWHCGWWVAWWWKGGCVVGIPVCDTSLPRSCVGLPFPVCMVVLLDGGGGVCCGAPSSDWILPFALSCPLRVVLFLFCLVCGGMVQCEMRCGGVCYEWRGVCYVV